MWLLVLLPFLWMEIAFQCARACSLEEEGVSRRMRTLCGLVLGLAFGALLAVSCAMCGELVALILDH
jgi:hypothetical protein